MILTGRPRPKLVKPHVYARLNNFGEQVLIVGGHMSAENETALVIAVPTKPDGRAVFVDVSSYGALFADIDQCWEPSFVISANPRLPAQIEGSLLSAGVKSAAAVHLRDPAELQRLHEHLRPPAAYVEAHAGFTFVAFKLKKGDHAIKPLAVIFETRDPTRAFFPMVQVVGDEVPERATLDHTLYLQAWTGKKLQGWFDADSLPHEHVDVARTQRLLIGDLRVHRSELRGERKNEDIWVRVT